MIIVLESLRKVCRGTWPERSAEWTRVPNSSILSDSIVATEVALLVFVPATAPCIVKLATREWTASMSAT